MGYNVPLPPPPRTGRGIGIGVNPIRLALFPCILPILTAFIDLIYTEFPLTYYL